MSDPKFQRDPKTGSLISKDDTNYAQRRNIKIQQDTFKRQLDAIEKKQDRNYELLKVILNIVHNYDK